MTGDEFLLHSYPKLHFPLYNIFVSFRITSLITNEWSKDVKLQPSTGVELELTLDTSAVRAALHDLHFIELKGWLGVSAIRYSFLCRGRKKYA